MKRLLTVFDTVHVVFAFYISAQSDFPELGDKPYLQTNIGL